MSNLEDVCTTLIQALHDEMRADIPDIRILGKRLLPSPWSQERIDDVASLLACAIRTGIEEDRQPIGRLA